jgi:hypothetical protein
MRKMWAIMHLTEQRNENTVGLDTPAQESYVGGMKAKKPKSPAQLLRDRDLTEAEAAQVEQAIRRLLSTPPQPHGRTPSDRRPAGKSPRR